MLLLMKRKNENSLISSNNILNSLFYSRHAKFVG
jgi:hypothetical protein